MRTRLASLALLLAACSTALTPAGSDSEGGETSSGSTGAELPPDLSATGTATTEAEAPDLPTTAGASTGLDTEAVDARDYGLPGPHPAGNATFTLVAGERSLTVEAWYPADPSAQAAAQQGAPLGEFVAPGPDQDALKGLLTQLGEAGTIGTRLNTRSARDAPPAAGSFPVIVFSHCHNCVRFSAFTIAEHLASHGFVVVAPDHAGNTLFDKLAGESAQVEESFLQVRAADLKAVLDAVLDPDDPAVPEAIRGRLDPAQVGAMGHSYGAGAVGRLAQEDDRVRAALPIAAPVQNPVFPGTSLAEIAEPQLFVLLTEDNSIQQFGNDLIESNFAEAMAPAYLVRLRDAGHWGVTDICGLDPDLAAGCGPGVRQTDGSDFVYLDPEKARAIVAAYAAAFFDRHLRGELAAEPFLTGASPPELVEVEVRP